MGKGRAPCCDKTKVKRGPWSQEEDLKLISFIQKFGHENWRSLPKQSGLLRCGKSCRLRWINYLRPDVKRGSFTIEEEETIIKLHKNYGNKWSKIASKLPGRTDNEIKNVWHTHIKKRLIRSSSADLNIDEPASSCSNGYVSCPKEDEDSLNIKTSQESSPQNELSTFVYSEDDSKIGLMFESSDIIQEGVDKADLLGILFESDNENWSFFDGSNTIQQSTANESSSISRVDEYEVKKWLKNLENELGLEEDDNQQHKLGTQDEEESPSLLKTNELMIH